MMMRTSAPATSSLTHLFLLRDRGGCVGVGRGNVLDYLERMNMHDLSEVSMTVIDMLQASGLSDTQYLAASVLIPRVLRRQQVLRRQLAALRRAVAT